MHRRTWGTSVLLGLVLLTGGLPASAQTSTVSGVSPPTKFEAAVLTHINNHRADIGCRALVYNSYLALAARRHNSKMMSARTLSHQLPGEYSLGKRITMAGYTPWTMLAENLAMGPTTPWGVYKLWMGSGPHRANIENCSLRNAALGISFLDGRSWSTLDFGRH